MSDELENNIESNDNERKTIDHIVDIMDNTYYFRDSNTYTISEMDAQTDKINEDIANLRQTVSDKIKVNGHKLVIK